jgi:hypothetical protein
MYSEQSASAIHPPSQKKVNGNSHQRAQIQAKVDPIYA